MQSEKRIAIIGASYLQLPLIEKASEMGYETHVFAWECQDVGEKAADFFYPVSIVEKDEILKICRSLDLSGICTIASDLAVITVNYVAEHLGLPGNSWETTLKSTNKHLMRLAFSEGSVPSPESRQISSEADLVGLDIEYPVIVKPSDRSGSRGITKACSLDELREGIRLALNEGFEKKVLIEEFAEGQEYSVECISQNGKHTLLAVTEKQTTGAPHFIETGHLEPAPLPESIKDRIRQETFHALDVLGIRNGASHSELKIDSDGNLKFIEIAGRMGGDAIGSHLVSYSTGYDFVKMVIDCAVGQPLDFTRKREPEAVESRFILTEQDLEDFYRMKTEHPDRILEILDFHPEKTGQTKDSSGRAGCYLIRSEQKQEPGNFKDDQ